MAKRRDGGSLLVADEWSTLWRCDCGYGNAGRERCLMCGARAPEAAQNTTGLNAEADVLPRSTAPKADAGRKARHTVTRTILANLVIQAVEAGFLIAAGVDMATSIRVSLLTGLAYYTFAAAWVWARSAELNIRPFTGLVGRKTLVGAAEGFIVGGVGAALLFAAIRVAVGRPLLDPSTALLTTQGNLAILLLGIVLIAVAAPVVEELVFRGFLAEAFRDRGKRVAVLVSAVAFSLAHLRLSQFRYYLGMGILLALVYWRRGLVGSITAHATFNGMLIVLAAAAAHGPALDVHTAGFTIAVPQTYHVSTDVFGEDLVAIGPLGAQIEFAHIDVDVPPARQLAGELVRQQVPFPPELAIDVASVAVLPFPAGEAVSVNVSVEGQPGRMVALPRPGRLWIATVVSDGNHRTLVDFDRMLASWRIP